MSDAFGEIGSSLRIADAVAVAAPGAASHDAAARAAVTRVADRCRAGLLDQVMPFWESRVLDDGHPGLLHQYDREGNLTGAEKSTWCQGRMAYCFALLAMELPDVDAARRSRWLEFSMLARDFIREHAYAGDGRWHYNCDRDGRVTDTHCSAFSDAFAVMGLVTHAEATGRRDDLPIIEAGFAALSRNLQDPSFGEYYHHLLDPTYQWHGPSMIGMGVVPLARAVLGDDATRPLGDWAMRRILWQFASDEHEVLLEMTDHDGRMVDTDQGRTTNPGHALEATWFTLEEAIRRRDRRAIDRALQVCRWAFEKGWDQQYGGIFSFVAPDGSRPPGDELVAWGDRWDDKLWWVQAESLYTLALATTVSGDPFYRRAMELLCDWTFTHMPDEKYGEWFASVTRDGKPQQTYKGNVFRSAFHGPRSLAKIASLGAKLAARADTAG